MFSKRKLTVMATVALLSTSLLAGCTQTEEKTENNKVVTVEDVLANQNARAAIAMAVDKQGYCDTILNNGSFPTNRFMTEGLAFDNGKDYADLTKDFGYEYNLEEAKEAWAKAKEELGFETIEMELLTFDHDSGKRTGEFVQAQLNQLEGLTVKVANLPFEQKLERESKGDFDISFAGWGPDYPDPLTFLDTMVTDHQYAKQVGYDNSNFNKLLEEAKALPTTEAYAKYAEAEKIMLEEAYLAPLFQKGASYLERDYVSGIIRNAWGADYTYTYADVDKPEKVLNLSTSSDIPTLDVSKATDQESFQTMNSAMEGLTRIDAEGKIAPGMATEWKASEDMLTWTFTLRDGAKWSNGTPLTAKDFEYSWKRTLDPATAAEYAYVYADIKEFKAVDDKTFEVTLNRPVAYFAELMSFQAFFPQNQAFVESVGDKYGTSVDTQIYNGPFTLKTWKMEDQYSLEKNPAYWDAANVKLEKINTKVVKDTAAAISLYEDKQIDLVGLSADYVDKYENAPEFKTRKAGSAFFLQINGGKKAE